MRLCPAQKQPLKRQSHTTTTIHRSHLENVTTTAGCGTTNHHLASPQQQHTGTLLLPATNWMPTRKVRSHSGLEAAVVMVTALLEHPKMARSFPQTTRLGATLVTPQQLRLPLHGDWPGQAGREHTSPTLMRRQQSRRSPRNFLNE